MKLLKLESETQISESVFTNNISIGSGLEFPVQAQVALKNLSMDFSVPTIIEITNDNNTFKFRTRKGTSYYTVILTNGKYTTNDLIKEIQTKMNNKLVSNGDVSTDYGFMWKVGFKQNEPKIVIAFDRADPITLASGTVGKSGIDYSSTGSYFYKTASNNNTFNSYLYGNVGINNGGFEVLTTIVNQTVPNNVSLSDWILGIDNSGLSNAFTTKTLIKDSMFACISVDNAYYSFKKQGALQTSTIPVEPNDILSIHKKDGKIEYSIKKGSSTTTIEGDVINDVMPELGSTFLTYSLHIGNDTGKIGFNTLKYTSNPFVKVSNGIYSVSEAYDTPNDYLDTNLTFVSSSDVELNFDNTQLRLILGYQNIINIKPAIRGTFTSSDVVSSTPFIDDMEVEILELGSIGSYSQVSKQLKGIIGVISKSELAQSTINTGFETYQLSWAELASFAWLSLDNNQPLRMPSLTVRCTSNNKLITMNGKLAVTLLYKPKDELN